MWCPVRRKREAFYNDDGRISLNQIECKEAKKAEWVVKTALAARPVKACCVHATKQSLPLEVDPP